MVASEVGTGITRPPAEQMCAELGVSWREPPTGDVNHAIGAWRALRWLLGVADQQAPLPVPVRDSDGTIMTALESGAQRAEEMFHLVALAVVLSILAHSSTDVPIAHRFARQRARKRRRGDQVTLDGDDDPVGPSFAALPAGERDRRDKEE